jgi:hypothetical protein
MSRMAAIFKAVAIPPSRGEGVSLCGRGGVADKLTSPYRFATSAAHAVVLWSKGSRGRAARHRRPPEFLYLVVVSPCGSQSKERISPIM